MTTTAGESRLAAALVAFQRELPRVARRSRAVIRGERGSYEFRFANLADLSRAVLPLLARHGLAFTTAPSLDDEGRFVLVATLVHASGEQRTAVWPLPNTTDGARIAAAITSGRRHCLAALVGVAADDDGPDPGERDDWPGVDETEDRRARAPQPPRRKLTRQERDALAAAKARVRSTAEIRGWDPGKVQSLYMQLHHGTPLADEQDVRRLREFVEVCEQRHEQLLPDPPVVA